MSFRYTSTTRAKCEAVAQHTKPVSATWQARFYQDPNRALELLQQGMQREKINQTIWDEACLEQDTLGVKVHKTMSLCTACSTHIIGGHAGADTQAMAMTSARISGAILLLVSDRKTERGAVVGNIPANTPEKDFLNILRKGGLADWNPAK